MEQKKHSKRSFMKKLMRIKQMVEVDSMTKQKNKKKKNHMYALEAPTDDSKEQPSNMENTQKQVSRVPDKAKMIGTVPLTGDEVTPDTSELEDEVFHDTTLNQISTSNVTSNQLVTSTSTVEINHHGSQVTKSQQMKGARRSVEFLIEGHDSSFDGAEPSPAHSQNGLSVPSEPRIFRTASLIDDATPSGTEKEDKSSNGEDEENVLSQGHRPRRRPGCRGRKNTFSKIKVKYTKVYGEDDDAYRNDSMPRGLVFMVNFSKFKDDKHREREGSEIDYQNMLTLFQQMGYGLGHRTNRQYCRTGYITKDEFFESLRAFSMDKKHKMLCSCVIIIMSHGSGPRTFISSDNKEIDLMEVYNTFDNIHCELLRGKPKIFILQFCRNASEDARKLQNPNSLESQDFHIKLRNVVRKEVKKALESERHNQQRRSHSGYASDDINSDVDPQSPIFKKLEESSTMACIASMTPSRGANNLPEGQETTMQNGTKLPFHLYEGDSQYVPTSPQLGIQRYSDMYSIFSTSTGEVSHRDTRKGTLLIQAICHVFAEFAYQCEIDTLVRKVSMYMTKTLQKDDPITVPRQTCERTNNGLDKYFYFNPEEIGCCRHVTI